MNVLNKIIYIMQASHEVREVLLFAVNVTYKEITWSELRINKILKIEFFYSYRFLFHVWQGLNKCK